jgi:vacuolar-type H+-ATPase subunit H
MTKLTPQLEKEITQLNEERNRLIKEAEEYKKQIYSQLLLVDKSEVSNTIQKEKKYSLWERILKTLGVR